MTIIEYKLHPSDDGMVTPKFVDDGGYWLNQDARSLTSGGTLQPVAKYVITIGSEIYFEGKNFEIYAQPNDNLGLKEIK